MSQSLEFGIGTKVFNFVPSVDNQKEASRGISTEEVQDLVTKSVERKKSKLAAALESETRPPIKVDATSNAVGKVDAYCNEEDVTRNMENEGAEGPLGVATGSSWNPSEGAKVKTAINLEEAYNTFTSPLPVLTDKEDKHFKKKALKALTRDKEGHSPLSKNELGRIINWLAFYRGISTEEVQGLVTELIEKKKSKSAVAEESKAESPLEPTHQSPSKGDSIFDDATKDEVHTGSNEVDDPGLI
ncbi:hypothetical protein U1Q18_032755 [Sarracenia purpurea var. burkii]